MATNNTPKTNSNATSNASKTTNKVANSINNNLKELDNLTKNLPNTPKNNNTNTNTNLSKNLNNLNKILGNIGNTGNKNKKNNNVMGANANTTPKNNGKNTSANTNKANNTISSKNNNTKANNSASATSTSILPSMPSMPSMSDITDEDSPIWTILKVVIGLVVLFVILYVAQYFYIKYRNSSANSPYLLEGNKNAKHALVVSQDPNNPNYIPINRSEEQNGIQFTYSFWFYIENLDYKNGEWKHIFHKGNSSSYPNRAPGVWIHPTKNTVRIYMNTQENILEFVDIDNIPVRKWVHMAIILNNQNLDIYVNGYLKERKALESIPRQNDDDFWINMFGGFEGFVSNIRYFSNAIDFDTINGLITTGPSKSNCIDTKEVPPYLDDNWWYQP